MIQWKNGGLNKKSDSWPFGHESASKLLKGCVVLLGSLEDDYVEDDYSEQGIKVLADVMRDAVSRIDEDKKRG